MLIGRVQLPHQETLDRHVTLHLTRTWNKPATIGIQEALTEGEV
jgi:hypothetical protein